MEFKRRELIEQNGFMGNLIYESELASLQAVPRFVTWRDPLELMAALEIVEGTSWINYQLETWDDAEQYQHVGPAIAHMLLIERRSADEPERFAQLTAGAEIYGQGGFNRYYLDGSGEVRFSEQHAIERAAVIKATQAGFKICYGGQHGSDQQRFL